jgi:hypothetical protein
MFAGGNYRFADNMREVGPDNEIHRNTDRIESWSSEETAANSKKAAEDADDEADRDKVNR